LNYFHFPRLGAVYLSIPKNACSTIKRSALVYEGDLQSSDDPRGDVHDMARKYHVTSEQAKLLWGDPLRISTFTVLSSPLRRYISSYLDKFCLSFPKPEPYVASFPLGVDISFLQFIQYISEAQPVSLNEHWRHQSSFISSGIEIDHFFWLNDMLHTPSLLIGQSTLPIMNVDHHSTSRIESSQDNIKLSIFSTAKEIHENLRLTNKLPPKNLFSAQLSEHNYMLSPSIFTHLAFERECIERSFHGAVSLKDSL